MKKTIQSVDELVDIQENRLNNKCQLFGIFNGNNQMLVATKMFYFNSIAHAQYLCADLEYNSLSPMSFDYYSKIIEMKKRKFSTLSWE